MEDMKAVILTLILWAIPLAHAGPRSDGGTPKPRRGFANENLMAILHDCRVNEALTLNREITEITRLETDGQIWTYLLTAEDIKGENRCDIKLDVWNTASSLTSEVRVQEIK